MATRNAAPTDDLLLEMAEHVAYDVWMLYESSQLLALAQSLRLGRPWQSAILESLLIHTRNLVHFLYPPRDEDLRDGDVLARDYPSDMVLPSRPDVAIVGVPASELANNISRRVAHVHETRADPGMDWAYAAVAEALVTTSLRYLATVKPPFADRFRSEFRKLGWQLDGLVASLRSDGEGLTEDVLGMRPRTTKE